MSTHFRAFVVNQTADGFKMGIEQLNQGDLPPGNVLIQVAYSSVNYKDALVCIPDGRVARTYPLVPGLELVGAIVESRDHVSRQATACWPMILATLRGFLDMAATASMPVYRAIFSSACLRAWTTNKPSYLPLG